MAVLIVILVLAAATALAAGETDTVLKLGDKTAIDSFSQGKLTIGGKLIRTDVLILADGTVRHPWATKKRHVLVSEDITDLVGLDLDVLVIGTGVHGLMKPSSELKNILKEKQYDVLYLKTGAAIEKLKALRAEGKKVAACFHIGC